MGKRNGTGSLNGTATLSTVKTSANDSATRVSPIRNTRSASNSSEGTDTVQSFSYTDKGKRYTYTDKELEFNFRGYASRAMSDNDCLTHGMEWYALARIELMNLAREYGHSFNSVAAAAAVLSSCMPWERNIPALVELLNAWRDGKRGTELPGVSRNFECVRKFERLMNGETPERVIVKRGKSVAGQSFKTLNFYFNLSGASHFVTVDVWMFRAMTGDTVTTYRPDGYLYVACASIIRNVAYELGIEPMQLQAIVWMLLVEKQALAHHAA